MRGSVSRVIVHSVLWYTLLFLDSLLQERAQRVREMREVGENLSGSRRVRRSESAVEPVHFPSTAATGELGHKYPEVPGKQRATE